MKKKLSLLLFLCLSLGISVFAQSDLVKEKKERPESYKEMLKRLKTGDDSVDFQAMRIAYAGTDAYSPYGCRNGRDDMFKALNAKEYKKALSFTDTVLDNCYVDINAHFVASLAQKELKNDEKFQFHNRIYVGLVRSIINNGDGKSMKTAWTVITVDEEYSVLAALGYRKTSQSLLSENGSRYDKLETVDIDDENKKATFYFNVDIVFKGYTKISKS